MLVTALSALTPLLLMILAGYFSYRRQILPENSAAVLNDFVYYFTLPALLFSSLAVTPFEEIAQGNFIAGYLVALVGIYFLGFLISKFALKGSFTENSMRAGTASFPNSGYLGLPIMMYLFEGSRQALLATTLGIILPIIIVILIVSSFALHAADKSQSRIRVVWEIVLSMIKTPLIGASFIGAVYSFLHYELPDFLEVGLHNFGMASVPCALFSVGILLARNKMELKVMNIGLVNLVKLIIHPLLAAACLWAFGVRGTMLLMGILLTGMPVAAISCVLAETYQTCEAETSATFLVSMILYIPMLYLTLLLTDMCGLPLING
ncbi:AEC family transporter [Desulfovibrio sp. JC010]|uniref:AEC family transporter n=1 Tax=Desulfovibrio sp. JC010 TaxID=2593641 RepID=UPI0013D36D02|nr:AEC family transporter [Desulfovibrio sp. JC010]NDV27578.1 AEC family transporter [Desulfovibrio sp. JC010]